MFKKLSKILFSLSLAVLTVGAGLLAFGGNSKADASNDLSITIEGNTYTLEGKDYNGEVFYAIDTPEDLALVSFMVSTVRDKNWAGYNFELKNDINLSSRAWTAIGTYDNPYTGKFNGNGFTINGLNASKDACESEVFYKTSDGSAVTLTHGSYYHDTVKDVYYRYLNGMIDTNGDSVADTNAVRGLVLQEDFDDSDKVITNVTPKNYYYYGLFGNVAGTSATDKAEISDVVMGKGCFAYRNNDNLSGNNVEAYSGILVAKADNAKFYNVYDAMADADTKYSEKYYFLTHDTAIDASKKYYTYDATSKTYVEVATADVANIATYYEQIYRVDTGLYTYYYNFNNTQISLYSEETMQSDELVVSFTISNGKSGSFIADDKAYYYDINFEDGTMCLNLKERYIVNEVVETTVDGETTIVNSIEIDGVTYYLRDRAAGGFWLNTANEDPASDAEAVFYLDSDTRAEGWITLNEKTYPYVYENEVFKVLAFSEVCTIGYVTGDNAATTTVTEGCEFYKGNYYRLNSIEYVGIGSIDDNATHDGILNVLGTTYYYDYKMEGNGDNRLILYSGDYPKYTGVGNNVGVGTIAIGGVDYCFDYDLEYGDLDISSINNYITDIPYTIAKVEGDVKVETLEKGTIFSFNVATPAGESMAYYYKKGTADYITAYRMIYEEGVGLSTLDYNSNFVTAATTLPQNYFDADAGEYYIVSDTAGYLFENWTIPTADGRVAIVSTAKMEVEGVMKDVLCSFAPATGTAIADVSYYTYDAGTNEFNPATVEVGVTDVSSMYELVDQDTTIENIKANNYQVNANWTAKSYTVNTNIEGTVTSTTVGYGMKWDTFISSLTLAGHDLTGVYFHETGVTTGTTDSNEKVFAYGLNYFYDNYGNLSTFSYIKTTDTTVDTSKIYYTVSVSSGFAKFTEVALPVESDIANYYEKAENVAVYGEKLSSGKPGISYFMVNWEESTLYLYTTWQRQPVNGKVTFSNKGDNFALTKDTALVEGKKYYTESDGVYTYVTAPNVANIGSYYEETTKYLLEKFAVGTTNYVQTRDTNVVDGKSYFTKVGSTGTDEDYVLVETPSLSALATYYERAISNGFEGIAMAPSVNDAGTNYYVKLSTEDENNKFGFSFNTDTGYSVNYVVPSTTGSASETEANFFVWDAEKEKLVHRYYDATETKIKEDDVEAADFIVGYFNAVNHFTQVTGTGASALTAQHGTGQPIAFVAGKYYVDIYNGNAVDGYAEVYVAEEVTLSDGTSTELQLIPCVTIYKNGNDYTYRQSKFTSNAYNLFVDIQRTPYEIGLRVTDLTNDPTVDYYVQSVVVKEDGVIVQTIGEIHKADTTTTMTVKYDSAYEIIVTPAANFSFADYGAVNMTALTAQETATGLYLSTSKLGGLSQKVEDDGSVTGPYYIFTLKESTFNVYGETSYPDGQYTAGAVVPQLQIQSLRDEDTDKTNQYVKNVPQTDVINFGQGAKVIIKGNDYYKVDKVDAYVFTIAQDANGIYLDRVNYNGVTVVNASYDTYFALINYAGKDYYVKNDSTEFIYNAEESRYDLVNATLYTIYDQNGNSTFDAADIFVLDMTINKGIPSGIIGNNDVLKLVPVLSKQKHNIEASATGVITEDRTAMTTIKDIEGNDTTLSGNAVSVTDNAGVEVSQYCYEQQVVVTHELNDDFYNFTGFYIEIGGTIYDLATRNNGTWTIGNYFYEASGQTQLGTVVTNGDNSIKLTFDKIAPSDVKIYAAFDGKIANIAIGDVKDASQNILLDAVVVDYDGKGANKAYTFSSSSDIISSTSSTISSVKFGDVGARTIVYRLSQDATMNLVGWAVYDSKVMNGTLEAKITIIYNYATPVTVTGSDDTVSMSYLDLFTNSADISVLENLFKGSSQYTLIPVLQQKTLTVKLTNAKLDGDGNGTADGETGADITGLTYYAGGDGLDISSHAAHFAKTGYTPSGWEGVAPISAYKTSENLIDLRALPTGLAGLYNTTIEIKRVYTPNVYEIEFELASGEELDKGNYTSGAIKEDKTNPYINATYDADFTLPSALKTGYTFKGWYVKGNTSVYYSNAKYKTAGNTTLVPHFTPNAYNVLVDANGGKLNGGSDESKVVSMTYDTVLSSYSEVGTAPTRAGYTFAGWFAKVSTNVKAISNSDILSVSLNESGKNFVNLASSEVLVLVAAWTRVDGYYTLTNSTEAEYTHDYSAEEVLFEAISEINADGTNVLTADKVSASSIDVGNHDNVTFSWEYSATGNEGTYATSPKTSISNFKAVSLKDVVDTGYYKLTIQIVQTDVEIITEVMTNQRVVTLERVIRVTINPRTIQVNNLESSYTGVFDGTSSPIEDFDEEFDKVNIDSVTIHKYEVGTLNGTTFTPGRNVGKYNAVRFYFAFNSGYEYVAGNYSGVGGSAGNYHFDQLLGTDAIEITPKEIVLTPVVSTIAYTGTAQTIHFTSNTNVGGQEIIFTANGTLTSFGSATSNTEVDCADFTISDKAISTTGIDTEYLTVSNYTYTLDEKITILANVLTYSFSGRILSKDTSDASAFSLPDVAENEAIIVDKINVAGIDFTPNSTIAATTYKKYTMGSISYFYSVDGNDTLYFQIINNAVEVKIYSMTPVASVELGMDNLVYNKDEVNYYLFGVYEVVATNAAEVAAQHLANVTAENATNRYFNNLEANKQYYVGYTNLVAVTLNGLGENGAGSEVKFVKFGSPLTTAGFNPTRTGYDFVGWVLDNAGETSVIIPESNKKQFTVEPSRASIAPLSLTAEWQLLAPTVETTNAISRDASEGQSTITAEQVIGSITNRNNYLTYTYAWYRGDTATGTTLSTIDSFVLDANTDSNGSYTLAIGIEGSALTTVVNFQVAFNPVAVQIAESGTYANKTGYYADGTQNLTDGKLAFTYSYGNAYQSHIYINVAGNTTSTANYNLADTTDGNIYFTIAKVGGSGVSTITDAGTYTITLNVNTKIYKIEGRSTITVEVGQAKIAFADGTPTTGELNVNLRTLLGIVDGQKVFSKTYGDNNSVLTKTFYVKKGTNQIFATQSEAGVNAQEIQITFAGTVDGLQYSATTGLQSGIGLSPTATDGDGYSITEAHADNANYILVVENLGKYPQLEVKTNTTGVIYFGLGSTHEYTYGDTVITRVALFWNSTESKWQLQGFDSEDVLQKVWDFESIVANGTSYETNKTDIEKYEISINTTNYPNGFKSADSYVPANALTITANTGASYSNVEFKNENTAFLTIAKATLTVDSVTKVCDTTTIFDSENPQHSATISGLKFTDESSVFVTGTYASTAFGSGITVTGLALTDNEISRNYVLSSTSTTGSITASAITVNIALAETEFAYGDIAKTSALDEIFGFVFTSTEIATIDRAYFTVSALKVVDSEGNDLTDAYSTGEFLNAGSYKLQYTIASQSFSNANKTATLDFEVKEMTLAPHTVGNVEITKIYNGNTEVEQTIVIDTLAGDVVTISAVYENANVGPVKVVTLTKSGADAGNYILSTSTLSGAITEREGVQILGHNDTITFVTDNISPVLAGATLDASNNFMLTVSPYNDATEATAITAVLGTPSRVGYTFGGWFTDADCTVAYNEDTIIELINAHIAGVNGAQPFNVYAKWTIKTTNGSTYAVEKSEAAHSTITVEQSTYNYYDTVVFTLSESTGYDITAYRVYNKDTGADLEITVVEENKYSFTLPDASVVITTTTAPETYEIAIENNGGVGTNPTSHTFGTATPIADLTRTGYTFLGWTVNGTGEPQKNLTLAGDAYTSKITLVANWDANEYRIYFDLGENESFSADMITTHGLALDEDAMSANKGQYYKVVEFDSDFTLPTTIKPGFGFVDWRKADNTVFADGKYTTDGNTVVTATYEAGTFSIKFNPVNVTINVYDTNNTPDKLMPNDNGDTYSFVGGKTYFIEVIADAGYTVNAWSFDGLTDETVLAEVTPVENKVIDITATANTNTISLYINSQDAPHVQFTVEVNDAPVALADITGGKSFEAATDAKVEVLVTVATGYELNAPTVAGMTFEKDENSNLFTLAGFTTNASMSFRLTALSYEIKVNLDADKKVTDLAIYNSTEHDKDESGEFWTATVTTGQGNNLQLQPTVVIGYSFAGVKFLNTTIAVDSQESNIEGTGVNISVTAAGLVTITGYTSGIEITLLTAIDEYELKLEIYALNDADKDDTSVTKALTVNGVAYVAGQKAQFGSEVILNAEVSSVGYKFVGWFTSATKDAQGKIEYAYQISADAQYTITMSNEDIKYYAIFERTYIDLSLNVLTNEDATNNKGGEILNASENPVLTETVLYKEEVSYTAVVSRGYEFKGWFVENVSGEKVDAAIIDGITVAGTKITIVANEAFKVYAKFEAKALTISITQGLLVNGVLTYPTALNYGNIVWGTYANGTFTPDANGTSTTIQTRTDDLVYVKATAEAGYLVNQIINTGTARFTITVVEETDEYSIYELSGMNSEDGEYSFIVRFYSTETILTINFKTTNDNIVIAGDADVQPSEGIMVKANRTANVEITAVTGSTITVRAYARLGYHFDKTEDTRQLVYNVNGTYKGTLNITSPIIPQKLDDVSLGYTEFVDFVIAGYTGGQIELSLSVVPSKYTIKLYGVDESLKPLDKAFTTITNVAGGSIITLSGQNKKDISELPIIEGYTLQGFYTYSSGSGTKYIDAFGNGVELNDNGYYWTGSEYKKLPYYTEDINGNGTFSLFAVYTMNKTAITISASPYGLTHTAPTLENKVVLETLNSANSWTVETDKYYAEVLHGAVINATAPKFSGYKFAYWKVERYDVRGTKLPTRYNINEKITDVLESTNTSASYSYSALKLTAIYNVHAQVESTNGGSAVVKGYTYTISSDMQGATPVEKITSGEFDFSSLEALVFRATPSVGYTFMGWHDAEGNIVSSALEYEIPASRIAPTYLKAVFEGDAKTLKVSADSSTLGTIVSVEVMRENSDGIMDWVQVENYEEGFAVKVGEQVRIKINIPDEKYEADWTGGYVETDMPEDYRVYTYTVSAEDEVSDDVIEIHASYKSRPFAVSVTFDLENKVSNEELKIMGTLVYDSKEIVSGQVFDDLVYGNQFMINITANKNYKVLSILVDGEEVIDNQDYFKNGTLTIQTNRYDYRLVQSVSIEIKFAKVLWYDEVEKTYTLTGKGTGDNPYKIASETDLAFVAYMINVEKSTEYASASYELMKDVDLTGKYWSPIGTIDNPFTGSFDFNVFEITGISVEFGYKDKLSHAGLFGFTSNAHIFKTESNIGLILGLVGGVVGVAGIGVGIFFGLRAKKKRELDKLANS